VFWSTRDGRAYTRTKGDIPGQVSATIDLDVVVLPSGRVIANQLDRLQLPDRLQRRRGRDVPS
jgi:hypothetical protein